MAASKNSSAVGAGAQSSWINQIHSCACAGFNESTATETASPKPHSRAALIVAIRADFNKARDESLESVSTATMESTGRDCELSAATVSANHA